MRRNAAEYAANEMRESRRQRAMPAKPRKLTQDDIANMVAHCAISFAKDKEVTITQRRHRTSFKPIVEISGENFAEVMAVYSATVQAMTIDEPFRAETTFFHTFQRRTVRMTAFATIGR